MVDILELLNNLTKYCYHTPCSECGIRELCDSYGGQPLFEFADRRIEELKEGRE